jgi:hypothetical protein
VRALVGDHDDPAALQLRHRDRPGAIPGAHDPADRDVDRVDVEQLRHPVVGVVAQLLDQSCADGAHACQITGPV